MKKALTFAAVAEAATGIALLAAPSLVGQLLFGQEFTGVAVPAARVTGIALIALAIACCPGPALTGMLAYSVAVTLYFAYLGMSAWAISGHFAGNRALSALPSKSDICGYDWNVRAGHRKVPLKPPARPLSFMHVRHTGFLVGYGQSAGDPAARTQTIEQVIKLLQTPPPWRRDLEPIYSSLEGMNRPVDWPAPDTGIEDHLFAVCTMIFVNPMKSERALNVLRRALGGKRCEYVLALLAFIRTAHFWTVVHPAIEMEEDVKQLMNKHKELASLLLQESDPWSG